MNPRAYEGPLEKVNDCCYRIPRSYQADMRVDGMIFADERLIDHVVADRALEQVVNVATLPGIQVASFAMPDIHWGYGFCIGGVCATDPEQGGVISPGGVGYDINCGVRLMRSNISLDDVRPHLSQLVDCLFARIPCGAGQTGKHRFNRKQLLQLLGDGSLALVDHGLAVDRDIEHTEAHGRLDDAEPRFVSERALERGAGSRA